MTISKGKMCGGEADNLVRLGIMSLNAGDVEKGIQQFEEALRIDFNHIGAYIGLVRAVSKEKSGPYSKHLESYPTEEVEAWLKANPDMLDDSNLSLLLIDKIIINTDSVQLTKAVLNAGAKPIGTYTLFYAIISNHSIEITEFLLEAGANPNKDYQFTFNESEVERRSPLADAIWRTKNIQLVKLLIEYGANVNYIVKSNDHSHLEEIKASYPLIDLAVRADNLPIVQLLLKNGADCNTTYEVQYRMRNRYAIVTETRSPLSSAICFSDDIRILQALLEAGANPKINIETDIYWTRADPWEDHDKKVISLLELARERNNTAAISVLNEIIRKEQKALRLKKLEAERASKINQLKNELSALQQKLSSLSGLFAASRRKRIENRLVEIRNELIKLENESKKLYQ